MSITSFLTKRRAHIAQPVEHHLGKTKATLGQLVYEDLIARGKREATARQWRSMAVRFAECCGIKETYERSDVVKFLASLRAEGFRESTLAVAMRPIKLLAQIQGWDFPHLSMPKVRESDITRPIFSFEDVSFMIRRGRQVLPARLLAYLALSTTYGLRREELCTLGDIGQTVTVNTVKGGLVTTHLVPPEIKPYIKAYRRAEKRYMTKLFQKMVEDLGFIGLANYGWHSIRRALVTELVNRDVSLLNIMRFMRWSDASLRGQFNMVSVYAARKQETIDRSIFEVHPFLSVWRNEVKGERSESAGTSPLTSGEIVTENYHPGGDTSITPLPTREK